MGVGSWFGLSPERTLEEGIVSIIWILVIIAVAVAPLVSALPSESQRYEAKIRAHAMDQGITVKLGVTPIIPPRFRMPEDLSLIAYRRRRLKRDQRFDEAHLAAKSQGVWVSVTTEKPLSEPFSSLPDGAWIAELGVDYVSIFWDEKGDIDAVDAVIAVLASLIDVHGFE